MNEQLATQQLQEELDACMTHLGSMLVVSFDAILYPGWIDRLSNRMLERVRHIRVAAVALSFDRVSSIDTPTIAALRRMVTGARLLGKKVYIAKLKPVIAGTIVNLGEALPGVIEVQSLHEALVAEQHRGVS